MSFTVTSETIAPIAIRSHVEPTEAVTLPAFNDNETKEVNLGQFVNTGNVNQVVAVEFTDVTGCSISGYAFRDDQGNVAETATLSPHEPATLWAKVHAADLSTGDSNTSLSFTVTSNWS